jgi:hypothetical protein
MTDEGLQGLYPETASHLIQLKTLGTRCAACTQDNVHLVMPSGGHELSRASN